MTPADRDERRRCWPRLAAPSAGGGGWKGWPGRHRLCTGSERQNHRAGQWALERCRSTTGSTIDASLACRRGSPLMADRELSASWTSARRSVVALALPDADERLLHRRWRRDPEPHRQLSHAGPLHVERQRVRQRGRCRDQPIGCDGGHDAVHLVWQRHADNRGCVFQSRHSDPGALHAEGQCCRYGVGHFQ